MNTLLLFGILYIYWTNLRTKFASHLISHKIQCIADETQIYVLALKYGREYVAGCQTENSNEMFALIKIIMQHFDVHTY